MPKRSTYGNISFTQPDGWVDSSTIMLLGPEPETMGMPTIRREVPIRPTFVIRRESSMAELTLGEFAKAQGDMMKHIMSELEIIETSEGTITQGEETLPMVLQEYQFVSEPHTIMRQIHAYFFYKDSFYLCIASGKMDALFEQTRKDFQALLASLQLGE